jgi:hypothetical protein
MRTQRIDHNQSCRSFRVDRAARRQPSEQCGGYPLTTTAGAMQRHVGSRCQAPFGGPDAFNSTETPMMTTRNIAIAAFIIAVLVLLILLL